MTRIRKGKVMRIEQIRTRRAVGLACMALLASAAMWRILPSAEPATAVAIDHSQVMSFLDEEGNEQPVRTPKDWQHRRKQIIEGMEEAMGPLPDRSSLPPLDMRIDETVEAKNHTRLKITFLSEGTDRVPAYLFLPKNRQGKAAAMLCLHQTTPSGKGEISGLGGMPTRRYAVELAERGYVTLAPDYPSFGDYAYDFSADSYVSGTMKGISNHMRAVDLLEGLDEVDPRRIGVIGHSLGGHNSMFVAVFDERLKVIVSSCGWTPFADYYEGKIKGWTSDRYMPRLRDKYGLDPARVPFDFYEVVAALAPRTFFSCSPLHDDNFEVEGVRKAIPVAAEVYKLLGAEDQLQVRYPDCPHDFPPVVRREAYEFLDKALGHTPTEGATIVE